MSEKDTKKNDLDINNKAEETVVGNEGETVGMIGEEAEGGCSIPKRTVKRRKI